MDPPLVEADMKIFLDTADVDEIRRATEWGLCDGVTTNPSLVMKAGRDYTEVLNEICGIVDGPISAEVVATDYEGMMVEARRFAKLHHNIVVKIPLIAEGLRAVKTCTAEGIKTNVTLCFSASQALLAAKAGATIISPFVGRLDDISEEGMELVQKIVTIYGNYSYGTEVLVASIRNPIHFVDSALIGADIATIPFGVLQKLFKHPLTDSGLQRFLDDWEKAKEFQKS